MIRIVAVFLCLVLLIGVVGFNFASAEKVPLWIKNTAKWYGEGKISETEFLNAIRYLVNNGIIILDESKDQIILNPSASTQELVENGIEVRNVDPIWISSNPEVVEVDEEVLPLKDPIIS